MIGEFVGTTMFLFFAFAGTQVANAGSANTTTATNVDNGFSPIVLLYTAVSFGFSLMVNVWIFFRISGGKQNYPSIKPMTHETRLPSLPLILVSKKANIRPKVYSTQQ